MYLDPPKLGKEVSPHPKHHTHPLILMIPSGPRQVCHMAISSNTLASLCVQFRLYFVSKIWEYPTLESCRLATPITLTPQCTTTT